MKQQRASQWIPWVCMMLAPPAMAEPCTLARAPVNYPGDTEWIMCRDSWPEQVEVRGLADRNISLVYQQSLSRCAVNDDRPGLQLVVSAELEISGPMIELVDGDTDELLCTQIVHIPAARPDPYAGPPDSMSGNRARFVDVDGIRTRYFEQGSGPPLVLVHGGQAGGSNNNALKWEHNIEGLARTFRVIALDRLAQAGTGNLSDPADYADYFAKDAQHLAGFMDALDLTDVSLVGHSQGGWPVTRLALNQPERVRCVVNVDTVMVPDDPALMHQAMAFMTYNARDVNPASGPTLFSARRGMALRNASGNNITSARARRIVDQYAMPKTQEAAKHMADENMTPLHDSFRALKAQAYTDIAEGRLKTRSLVVWGAKDRQVPLGLGEQFNEMLTRHGVETTLAVIPRAGHAPFIEFPEAFNELIVRYCGPEPTLAMGPGI